MAHGELELEFQTLLDAVLCAPETVATLVASDRKSLEATNRAGENVLRWCALENRSDDVELLRSLGSSIQTDALTEAVEMGNTDMFLLLLELGGEITPGGLEAAIQDGLAYGLLTKRQAHIVRSHGEAHGVCV